MRNRNCRGLKKKSSRKKKLKNKFYLKLFPDQFRLTLLPKCKITKMNLIEKCFDSKNNWGFLMHL